MKRGDKVGEILNEDAKRRYQKKMSVQVQSTNVISNESKAVVSQKSQKVIYQRLISDFSDVCQHHEA